MIDPARPYSKGVAIGSRAELITAGAHEHGHELSRPLSTTAWSGRPTDKTIPIRRQVS